MTDAEYVLDQLRAGPRDAMQIINASIRDREIGLTVHSRVASLRDKGYVISCAIEGKTRKGRERYVYRLVSEPESAASPEMQPTSASLDEAGSAPGCAPAESTPPPALVEIEGQLVLIPVPA